MDPYRNGAEISAAPGPVRQGWPVIGLAIAGVVVGFATWTDTNQHAALERLPAAERMQLLDRTLANLELCERHHHEGLQHFCETQTDLARSLPECDARCLERTAAAYPSRAPSARP